MNGKKHVFIICMSQKMPIYAKRIPMGSTNCLKNIKQNIWMTANRNIESKWGAQWESPIVITLLNIISLVLSLFDWTPPTYSSRCNSSKSAGSQMSAKFHIRLLLPVSITRTFFLIIVIYSFSARVKYFISNSASAAEFFLKKKKLC